MLHQHLNRLGRQQSGNLRQWSPHSSPKWLMNTARTTVCSPPLNALEPLYDPPKEARDFLNERPLRPNLRVLQTTAKRTSIPAISPAISPKDSSGISAPLCSKRCLAVAFGWIMSRVRRGRTLGYLLHVRALRCRRVYRKGLHRRFNAVQRATSPTRGVTRFTRQEKATAEWHLLVRPCSRAKRVIGPNECHEW